MSESAVDLCEQAAEDQELDHHVSFERDKDGFYCRPAYQATSYFIPGNAV